MSVNKEKQAALQERMKFLGIEEGDLLEKFVIGSGKGGQKLQKTHSCVYLCHKPSGTEVKCQKDRSREVNRFLARRELCDKIEAVNSPGTSKKEQAIEKQRKQKQRRSRRTKKKLEP